MNTIGCDFFEVLPCTATIFIIRHFFLSLKNDLDKSLIAKKKLNLTQQNLI